METPCFGFLVAGPPEKQPINNKKSMRLIIEPDYEKMSKWAANYVAKCINEAKRKISFNQSASDCTGGRTSMQFGTASQKIS